MLTPLLLGAIPGLLTPEGLPTPAELPALLGKLEDEVPVPVVFPVFG